MWNYRLGGCDACIFLRMYYFSSLFIESLQLKCLLLGVYKYKEKGGFSHVNT